MRIHLFPKHIFRMLNILRCNSKNISVSGRDYKLIVHDRTVHKETDDEIYAQRMCRYGILEFEKRIPPVSRVPEDPVGYDMIYKNQYNFTPFGETEMLKCGFLGQEFPYSRFRWLVWRKESWFFLDWIGGILGSALFWIILTVATLIIGVFFGLTYEDVIKDWLRMFISTGN